MRLRARVIRSSDVRSVRLNPCPGCVLARLGPLMTSTFVPHGLLRTCVTSIGSREESDVEDLHNELIQGHLVMASVGLLTAKSPVGL